MASKDGVQPDPAQPALAGVPAIDIRGLQKIYGATVALENAWLTVRPGEIHGLLGENGAGKSTLVRILAGVEAPDGGTIRIFGTEIAGDVGERHASGCAVIHQDLGLFDDLTVADNIAMVAGFATRLGLISRRRTRAAAAEVVARLGLDVDVDAIVGSLTLADQAAVAVARALSRGARVVVLDEPTAYLEAHQARRLFGLLHRLRDEGLACVLITHRAEDVLASCDALTVLREGATVASRPAAGLTEPELVELITGQPAAVSAPRARILDGPPRLSCRALTGPGFRDVSFDVRRGEVFGICGLADAGHFAVAEGLFGIEALTGDVALDGRALRIASVGDAIGAGLAFVPRDRRQLGLAGEMSARENLFMSPSQPFYRPLLRRGEREQARGSMERLLVRPPEPERQVATFSGGNQQKILLAKWLRRGPVVLFLNEPTAGVDLGAKSEIYDRVRAYCAESGAGVVVASSDFTEIAEFCDRAVVMRRGRITAEVTADDLSSHRLTTLAYGGQP